MEAEDAPGRLGDALPSGLLPVQGLQKALDLALGGV